MGDDARVGVQPGRERRGVAGVAAVVGDHAAVGAGRRVAQLDLTQPGKGRGEPEGEQLQGHRRAQLRHRLARVDDHHEALRGRGDDLLAQVGPATALDEPAVRGHLVGAVDRDVEALEALEGLDLDPQPAGRILGRRRGGYAADPGESAFGQRRQQVGDGGAGAQADPHSVLDHGRRGPRRRPPSPPPRCSVAGKPPGTVWGGGVESTAATTGRIGGADGGCHHTPRRRYRPALHQHDPDPLDRRNREGPVGASGDADGAGPARLHALAALPALRPRRPDLAEPRPLRALRRPRLDAALLAPAPGSGEVGRLRVRDPRGAGDQPRRHRELSPARLEGRRAP